MNESVKRPPSANGRSWQTWGELAGLWQRRLMLSAIVLAPRLAGDDFEGPGIRVRSLAVLVGAAVADLVRDAVIAGPADLRPEG